MYKEKVTQNIHEEDPCDECGEFHHPNEHICKKCGHPIRSHRFRKPTKEEIAKGVDDWVRECREEAD